ncbi:MAG: cell surface protein SprA [Bacteroidales bacterium]|nr:cell surface protein SprA [Porphyromonas sp.]MDD6933785.1 cell surface protein SprA [Bacteroidales bacterium]MDY3101747.1 cell surface protein SprA [Porphyromonas sp.]
MAKVRHKRSLWSLALATLFLVLSGGGGSALVRPVRIPYRTQLRADTTTVRFPIQKTRPNTSNDITKKHSLDLRTPSQIKSEFIYDGTTGNYLYVTTLNGKRIGTPIVYTTAQYLEYLKRRDATSYFAERDREAAQEEGKKQFNPFDFGFELGPAEKIFGPGGVKLKTQGSAEILFGVKSNATDNPSLPQSSRNHTFFDFDEKIQANVQATVGTKLNFGLNYNTETTFDTDARKLKLAYEGEEDDIVKLVEAGNVSLQPKNSLIQGGASLFGLHTKLQFGKLQLSMVVSQQEAETKRVSSERGAQTTLFEFSANNYDENRHFFLGHYFRDRYDHALSTLPFISSGVVINRVEVWITNKRARFEESRNIVALSDLGEPLKLTAPGVTVTHATGDLPDNRANSLYADLLAMPDLRRIDRVGQALQGKLVGGNDYEKLESARRLTPNEYTLNTSLGYISLNTRLSADEVLGIAYEYTYQGKVYQVGEFSTDRSDNSSDNLFVKLVKGSTMTPTAPYWHFMMRNIYALGTNVSDLQQDRFKLDIYYRNDAAGTALPYLDEGEAKGKLLVQLLDMDRLDSRKEAYPDGVFDFVEGYTVQPARGLIIFSTVEPFGKTLRAKIGDDAIADKYVYQEIYDATSVAARQVAEKDKFVLKGEYKASSSGQISLGAGIANVTPGSVRVTAGGATLTENVDYTVNYAMGTVTIINESILNSGTRVDVSLENKGLMNMQRKTVVGVDANYNFSKDFTLGATFMHLSEMPLTTKSAIGSESMSNTLWGANLSYRSEWQGLTNLVDKLPFLDLTKPSELRFNAEFAHLIPGHYESRYAKGYSYIDDFESSQGYIDLMNPYAWMLSSTPYQDGAEVLFPEAALSNDVRYGNRRARLAWYYIDPMFNRANSSLTPSYIRNNPELLSNHYVREVSLQELFPYRDYNQSYLSYLQTFSLSYYPKERGPYNLNAEALLPDGSLSNPEENWGGIMRKVDQSDFEAANIEYVEFWLLDPFIYNHDAQGGNLYINLGEVSEEVLRDEKKFFENGIPINDDPQATERTIWGKVPLRQGAGYAFDNTPGARAKQDVGFNGLNDEEERTWPVYVDYLNVLRSKVGGEVLARWQNDPMSPLADPAGDNFMHFRNSAFDEAQTPILDRYKYYNGVQGNSAEATNENDPYSTASRSVPDAEDINQDNTLNENEKYFEYKLSLKPSDMIVGKNHIVDVRPATVSLPNGNRETVNWYQFKIPVRGFDRKVGGIADFKTIRFMRMYLTGFRDETFLRFGTLKLVRGDWRQYDRELHDPSVLPSTQATLEVSAVNIEENGDRQPINYILPPGVLRSIDPSQSQATQQNEQSLSLKIQNLAPGDARAVYRNTGLDLRRYKKLELFAHAERIQEATEAVGDGDLSVFIRLGSDYRNNYYEYAVPLKLTPYGLYSTDVAADRRIVWPDENKMTIVFAHLTDLKGQRNLAKSQGDSKADFALRYSKTDPDNPRNTITVVGNPSLSNVKTIMIGVRNNGQASKSAEVWVNELRLSDYLEQGGWAANADMQLQVSDWGNVTARGMIQTAGFGALDQSLSQRRLEDLRQVNISSNFEMGRFFPEKAHVTIPLYYAYTNEVITPRYNPLDQDVLLSDALKATTKKSERDSIKRMALTETRTHSLSLSNVRVDVKSKTPMPYDPANFSVSYSYNQSDHNTPDLVYDSRRDWQAAATYDYSPVVPPIKPFAWIKSQSNLLSNLKNYQINWLPSKITISTHMVRNYSEQKVRNYIPSGGVAPSLPATFVQNFIWDRSLAINWAPTSHIQFSFRSGTNARIEEPHVQVNRQLEPDLYKVWRDSVNRSIAQMGRPMKYDQTATLSWQLPFALIPYMNWVNGSVSYTGTYNWDLGAQRADGVSFGNIIRNEMRLDGSLSLSFMQLYRQIPFFAEIEKNLNNPTNAQTRRRTSGEPQPTKVSTPKRYTQDITLRADSVTIVRHNLGSKKLKITARTSSGKNYKLNTRMIDENTLEIRNKDTLTLALNIVNEKAQSSRKEMGDNTSRFTQHLAYTLMMLRDVNITYNHTNNLNLPGFMPEIGSVGGQSRQGDVLAPGLAFAFGLTDNQFVEEAARRGWLTHLQENVNPSAYSQTDNLGVRITLEPIRDLRISLNANRNSTQREETQFVFEGMPRTWGGSFMMTTIGLGGFFSTSQAEDGYASHAFSEFLSNRAIIAQRLTNQYRKHTGNTPFEVRENSADVLIPAFLAAYTSSDVNKVALSPFPSLRSLLPNWSVTYTGLNKIPLFSELFRNFSLSHTYTSTYTIGNYGSLLGWNVLGEGDTPLGFLRQAAAEDLSSGISTDQRRIASMPYDIPSVALQEGFNPLIGLEVTFKSGMTLSSRWNKRRALNLNITAFQLIESASDEISAGIGYKVDDFFKWLGIKRKRPSGRKAQNALFTSGGSMTLRLDYSYNRTSTLIRKIQENFSQATNGNIAHTLKFSADYALSRMLTLRAYYDWNMNHPLVSTASFPMRNSNFGVSLRINLTQ